MNFRLSSNKGYSYSILSIHKVFNKSAAYSRLLSIILVSLFLLLSIFAPPVHAVKLTFVKHLFDISHNFKQPSDVAVSGDGLVYIVDGVNNKIKVFNQEGKFNFSFGTKGALNGQFNFPLGIDVGSEGKVYVADSGNHRIQIFNSSGKYLSQIKVPSKDDNPSDPTDVVVNNALNRLYAADNNNHQIVAYDISTGSVVDTYGEPGMEKREFRYPFLMEKDSNDYLYSVDVINARVQVLHPEGKFVMYIGGWGVEKGRFFRPKGVAVDGSNNIYVSDSYMGVIQVFQPDSAFHSVIGDPDSRAVKKFVSPVGMFIDKNNRLYVVEMFAEKVSVYSIEAD